MKALAPAPPASVKGGKKVSVAAQDRQKVSAVPQKTTTAKVKSVKAAASFQQLEVEDDFLDDFPPAPADSTLVRKGDAVKYSERVLSLDCRGVSACT